MINYFVSDIKNLEQAALEFCSSYTKCAIGIYELDNNKNEIIEWLPTPYFEPFCKKVQSNPLGKELCHQDHLNRARTIFKNKKPLLTLCHAGVYNQGVPINIGSEIKNVILYGQMLIKGSNFLAEGQKRLDEFINHMQSDEDNELELRILYDEIKVLSNEELTTLNSQISLLEKLYYEMSNKELEIYLHTEDIVHELQTRLQPVLAQAETLSNFVEGKDLTYQNVVNLGTILFKNVLAMRNLIWTLDTFTPPYIFEEHSLRHLVEEAFFIYQGEANKKFIKLKNKIKEPSSFEMSKVHLQLAMNNLVHNAIKYSYRGLNNAERYIDVVGEIDKNTYRLSIANYGVGILEEEYDKIFTPGYKSQLTRNEHRSGAGLGLKIVKDIIKKHNGNISVKSIPLDGRAYMTTFTVELPRTQPADLQFSKKEDV
jgi:signal transduction histidine kinase